MGSYMNNIEWLYSIGLLAAIVIGCLSVKKRLEIANMF